MASDRQQFRRATEKWQRLQDERAFSAPPTVGKLAIFCSAYEYTTSGDIDDESLETVASMRKEAREIYGHAKITNQKTVIIESGTGEDLDDILKDPSISSIVTIGHGALSYIYTSHGIWHGMTGNRYNWYDASKASDHLKTGIFIQRQCGTATCDLSVPLGAFVTLNHTDVWAAANQSFNPVDIYEPENEKIKSVTPYEQLGYEEVKQAFSYTLFRDGPPES